MRWFVAERSRSSTVGPWRNIVLRFFAMLFWPVPHHCWGVRESRRVVGDYIFTAEDWLARRTFPDEICRNNYVIDIHPRIGKDGQLVPSRLKISDAEGQYKNGESHGIPYRCLTPKEMPNLLTAGRCISCDEIAHGSVRVMPTCLVVGEGAGIAAGDGC